MQTKIVQRLISSSQIFEIAMANFKLTISDIKGKSITKELKEGDANPLMGLIVGAETDAAIVGLAGKLKITGGSDKSGVPMRGDLHGMARKRVLLSKDSRFTRVIIVRCFAIYKKFIRFITSFN